MERQFVGAILVVLRRCSANVPKSNIRLQNPCSRHFECNGDISLTESVISLEFDGVAPFMTRLLAWLASIRRSGVAV